MPDYVVPQSFPLSHRRQPVDHGIADRKALSVQAVLLTRTQCVSVVGIAVAGLVAPRLGAEYHALNAHQDRNDRGPFRLPSLFGPTVEGVEKRQTY